MDDISVKYNLLEKASKKTISDLIDFLLVKQQQTTESKPTELYKNKILKVSTWSEEEISLIQQNLKWMNEWKVENW